MSALAWLIAIGLLVVGFGGYIDQQRNPNQKVSTETTAAGERRVTLFANRQGHYVATGRVNDARAEFLLDTGATDVSVPAGLAREAGLVSVAKTQVMTANGVIAVDVTVISRVQLGEIVLRNVRATINPFMEDDVVLLGMAFLGELDLRQRDGVLTLTQYP